MSERTAAFAYDYSILLMVPFQGIVFNIHLIATAALYNNAPLLSGRAMRLYGQ